MSNTFEIDTLKSTFAIMIWQPNVVFLRIENDVRMKRDRNVYY